MGKKWTNEDVRKLKKLYPKTPMESLCKIFERTSSSLQAKAGRTGVKQKEHRNWTTQEIQTLKKLYPTMQAKDLCKIFQRSLGSIAGMIERLGLSKRKKWTNAEIKKLKKLYGNIHINTLCEMFHTGYSSIHAKAKALDLKFNGVFSRHSDWTDIFYNKYEKLPEIEKAYIAGLVDGEGCIDFSPRKYRPNKSMHVSVEISNTFLPIMKWLKDKLGGNYYERKKSKKHPNWKICYCWEIGGITQVKHLLIVLRPFLQIKAKMADKVLNHKTKYDPR